MNLGIEGRTAIICGSSQGLGLACAEALAREGVNVIINGRDAAKLEKTAAALRAVATGLVTAMAADIATTEGRERLIAAAPTCDILINNNGGPKPGNFADIDHDTWMRVIEANMVAPLMLTRGVLAGMKQRKFGRIVNITSAMVTTPRPHNMLPERFDTDRQVQMAKAAMERDNISYEEARARQVESIAAKRLGDPKEFGATCAFLCSAFAGFMSGQNLHLDGGSYPALI